MTTCSTGVTAHRRASGVPRPPADGLLKFARGEVRVTIAAPWAPLSRPVEMLGGERRSKVRHFDRGRGVRRGGEPAGRARQSGARRASLGARRGAGEVVF